MLHIVLQDLEANENRILSVTTQAKQLIEEGHPDKTLIVERKEASHYHMHRMLPTVPMYTQVLCNKYVLYLHTTQVLCNKYVLYLHTSIMQ